MYNRVSPPNNCHPYPTARKCCPGYQWVHTYTVTETFSQWPSLYNSHLSKKPQNFVKMVAALWRFDSIWLYMWVPLSLLQGGVMMCCSGKGWVIPCRHHQHWQESGVSQGTFGFPVAVVGWIVMLSYLENLSAWKKDWNASKNEKNRWNQYPYLTTLQATWYLPLFIFCCSCF